MVMHSTEGFTKIWRMIVLSFFLVARQLREHVHLVVIHSRDVLDFHVLEFLDKLCFSMEILKEMVILDLEFSIHLPLTN